MAKMVSVRAKVAIFKCWRCEKPLLLIQSKNKGMDGFMRPHCSHVARVILNLILIEERKKKARSKWPITVVRLKTKKR